MAASHASPVPVCNELNSGFPAWGDLEHSVSMVSVNHGLDLLQFDAVSKILAILLIFSIAVAAAAVPVRLVQQQHQFHSYHVVVKYGNAFSAGIFLAMGVIHLLPEASHAFTVFYGEEFNSQFRPAELLCIVGYALILALQRVVFTTPTCPHTLNGDTHTHSHGHGGHEEMDSETPEHMLIDGHSCESTRESAPLFSNTVREYGSLTLASSSLGSKTPLQTFVGGSCCRSAKHCVDESDESSTTMPKDPLGVAATEGKHPQPPSHLLLDRSERMAQSASQWTLMLALSAHAVCEGLALGLQCGLRNVAVLASAIAAHKWAESFALSNSLMHEAVEPHGHSVDYRVVREAWRKVLLFASATPVGIILGAIMHSQLPRQSAGVIKALSAGTFMYIGASEVVVEEFVQGQQYWGKWFCFLGGVALMYGLTVWQH